MKRGMVLKKYRFLKGEQNPLLCLWPQKGGGFPGKSEFLSLSTGNDYSSLWGNCAKTSDNSTELV